MNIDDERTVLPVTGDASDRTRTHADPSAGKASSDMRGGIDDPPWGSSRTGHDAHGDTGTYSYSNPPDAGNKSVFVSSYFRSNLPAILIVCIIAAAIGVAVGTHFAADPLGHAAASRNADSHPRQNRTADSAASPSDTMMLRIEEMRRIASEDATDDVSGAAGSAGAAPAAPAVTAASVVPAAPVAKRPEQGMAARQPQPATENRSSSACTAASMALALCDHQ